MKLQATPFAIAMLAGGADAFFGAKEPPKPTPHIIDDFKWQDPYGHPKIGSFEAACEHTVTLPAREFTLADLSVPAPQGLRDWSPGLKKLFTGREYPGAWGGLDRHLNDRTIISMEYKDVPLEVRLWIEDQDRTDGEGKGLFGVFEKPKEGDDKIESPVEFPSAKEVDRSLDEERLAIFAPGALYHILPLWAAETSPCRDVMSDLSKYKIVPEDGAVVGWVEHKRPKDKEIEFRIKMRALKAKAPEASAAEAASETQVKEEL
ncbi:hypothetical protein NLU13_6552 [Sarocladium strictum]|uniref:Uncharacterized protein n=1 Tax=Sarocladium strictum TaxID=5046 RepID=A0AA39L792_SARSR|nr:hypothetical protein NLU13_6552 [Sarocladium strictum]